MRVSGLRVLGRGRGLVAVEVDGTRFALLSVERVKALGLAVGRALGDADAATLQRAAAEEQAYQAGVRSLAARPRSVREIIQRLRKKGFGPDAVSEAVARLEAAGVLDDVKFASGYARVRAERGYGAARIRGELARKGVDRQAADAAVGEAGEWAKTEALVAKRAAQLRHLPRETRLRRVVAFGRRRGLPAARALELARTVCPPDDTAP